MRRLDERTVSDRADARPSRMSATERLPFGRNLDQVGLALVHRQHACALIHRTPHERHRLSQRIDPERGKGLRSRAANRFKLFLMEHDPCAKQRELPRRRKTAERRRPRNLSSTRIPRTSHGCEERDACRPSRYTQESQCRRTWTRSPPPLPSSDRRTPAAVGIAGNNAGKLGFDEALHQPRARLRLPARRGGQIEEPFHAERLGTQCFGYRV